MKTAIVAVALCFGGAAFAQSTTESTTPHTTMMSATGTSHAAPTEKDARGIPVVSDPAEVPAGANSTQPIPPGAVFTPNPNQAQVFTPRPATEEYPACSRTNTDNCVQTYERGRSPQ